MHVTLLWLTEWLFLNFDSKHHLTSFLPEFFFSLEHEMDRPHLMRRKVTILFIETTSVLSRSASFYLQNKKLFSCTFPSSPFSSTTSTISTVNIWKRFKFEEKHVFCSFHFLTVQRVLRPDTSLTCAHPKRTVIWRGWRWWWWKEHVPHFLFKFINTNRASDSLLSFSISERRVEPFEMMYFYVLCVLQKLERQIDERWEKITRRWKLEMIPKLGNFCGQMQIITCTSALSLSPSCSLFFTLSRDAPNTLGRKYW